MPVPSPTAWPGRILGRALIAGLLALLIGAVPYAAADQRDFLLRCSPAQAAEIAAQYRLRVVEQLPGRDVFKLRNDDNRSEDAVEAEVRTDVRVVGFERNHDLELPESPPDVSLDQSTAAILESLPQRTLVNYYGQIVWNRYAQQPAVDRIRLPQAQLQSIGNGVIVAVVDTGIDPNHPVLRDLLVPGFDFVRNTAGTPNELADLDQSTAAILEQSTAAILERDRVVSLNQSTAAILEGGTASALAGRPLPAAFGHGTMVAGLVHLVAPGARIMPLKAFAADGSSSMYDIVRAVYFAADNGARVINMSFTMRIESDELKRALQYAGDRGVLAIASAGNEGAKIVVYPAAWSDAFGVGSTGDLDQRSRFSNFGSNIVRAAAPGEGVVTTWPAGHFAAAWGTSFSTAIVAGAGALLISGEPANAPLEARRARADLAEEALRQAVPIGQDLGAGRIDLALAVAFRQQYDTQAGPSLPPAGDADGDGIPNAYEVAFGLNPLQADGGGDADGDGRTNLQEFQDGTHPRGTSRSYFAEGVANAFFDTRIALANPDDLPARVQLRFQRSDGPNVPLALTLPGHARATVRVADLPAVANSDFATVIESDRPIVADRTVTWDPTGYGSHAERASTTPPQTTWYLAEGATNSVFSLFYLVQNPGNAAAEVRVTFLRPAGRPPVVITRTVAAASRATIYVNQVPGLENEDLSAVIESTNGVPIFVERAMYVSTPGQPFAGGSGSAALPAPATVWFLAEGATGPFFDTFVLLGNPQTSPADVELTYLLPDGQAVVRTRRVAAQSRLTIRLDDDPALGNTPVSTRVRVTNGVPIVVERAMWWPDGAWQESHVSGATTETGTEWLLAEGDEGGPGNQQTYVLIANTGAADDEVRVTLLFEDASEIERDFALRGNSRLNVAIGREFPAARGRRFAIRVRSDNAPIVVERSIYADANGVVWAAGSNAGATKLR